MNCARASFLAIAGMGTVWWGFGLHAQVVENMNGTQSAVARYFPVGAVWTQDVTEAAVDPESPAMISWLANHGGWGTGRMRVDFEIRVTQADASSPRVRFRRGREYYSPDSDDVSSVPLPFGGGIEGQSGYQCAVGQQDCHLIVMDRDHSKLYEAYEANYTGEVLTAVFIGVWDLSRIYPPSGRGDQCTSADAAGFPIAPLLFNADELAAGTINHAIRFIMPNDRIRAGVFVHPATHAGAPEGPDLAPPFGAHFRLRSSYDVSHLKPAAQVVARAMQKYGMYLADGGDISLTAQSDADTRTKYAAVGFGPNDLDSLKITDFEILEMGKPIEVTNECVRNR